MLPRPIVSNVDYFAIQLATKNPQIDYSRLHMLILNAFFHKVKPIIIINKIDLINNEEKNEIEQKLSFLKQLDIPYFFISTSQNFGIEELEIFLKDKITALGGPSGVGKSSLSNMLQNTMDLKTGETSERLKRGKHTTRDSNLLKLNVGGYIIDTPGFSSIEAPDIENLQDLIALFPEFQDKGTCRFLNCSHTHEPQCAIKEAVLNNKINIYRYDFYEKIYNVLKDRGKI